MKTENDSLSTVSYTEITNFVQGYIENEVNFNREGSNSFFIYIYVFFCTFVHMYLFIFSNFQNIKNIDKNIIVFLFL